MCHSSFAQMLMSCRFYMMSTTATALLYFVLSIPLSLGQTKLTNVDFLGLGYDAVYGNPHFDLHDPGFRDAVFKLQYNEN